MSTTKLQSSPLPSFEEFGRKLTNAEQEWEHFQKESLPATADDAAEFLVASDRFLTRAMSLGKLPLLDEYRSLDGPVSQRAYALFFRAADWIFRRVIAVSASTDPKDLLKWSRLLDEAKGISAQALSQIDWSDAAVINIHYQQPRITQGARITRAKEPTTCSFIELQEILQNPETSDEGREEAFTDAANWLDQNAERFARIYAEKLFYATQWEKDFQSGRLEAFHKRSEMPEGYDEYAIGREVLKHISKYHDQCRGLSKHPGQVSTSYAFIRPSLKCVHITLEDGFSWIKEAALFLHPEFAKIVHELREADRIRLYRSGQIAGSATTAYVPLYGCFLKAEYNDSPWTLWHLAHEIGHAVHWTLLGSASHFFHSPSALVSETVGQVFALATMDRLLASSAVDTAAAQQHILYQSSFAMFRRVAFAEFDFLNTEASKTAPLNLKILRTNWELAHKALWNGLYNFDDRFEDWWAVSSWVMGGPLSHPLYTHSMVLSLVLYNRLRQDAALRNKFLGLLRSGGEVTTQQFFEGLGINAFAPSIVSEAVNVQSRIFNGGSYDNWPNSNHA